MADASGLKIIDQFEFGESYFKTLKLWLDNFNNNVSKVRGLGFDDNFIRKWQFYLAYCAAGFYGKRTDVVQYTMTS
jgi:cyclopropane-fatty-acyl-phospholipid synthase